MRKVMKNWIFTLVVCILLAALATVLFLDVNGIFAEQYIAVQYINFLTAAVLLIYVAIGVIPMFTYYRGRNIFFLIVEILVMATMIFALVGVEWFEWIPVIPPCSAVGFAIWIRSSVLIVRAYLQQDPPPVESRPMLRAADEEDPEVIAKMRAREKRITARTPLWMLCAMILLSAVGVWQMAAPILNELVFAWVIAIMISVVTIVFVVLTVQNFRARPRKVKPMAEDGEPASDEDLPAVEKAEEVEILSASEETEQESADAEETPALPEGAKPAPKKRKTKKE